MAKGKGSGSKTAKNAKNEKKNITFTPFLFIGIVIVLATTAIQSFFPGFPEIVRNILYFLGIMALLLYMFQGAFERRTGKSEPDGERKTKRLR